MISATIQRKPTTRRATSAKPTPILPEVLAVIETELHSNIFVCKVRSQTWSGGHHKVTIDTHAGTINGAYPSSCDCTAGAFKQLCHHQKAAVEAVKAFKAERWRMNQLRIGAMQQDWRAGWPWGDESA